MEDQNDVVLVTLSRACALRHNRLAKLEVRHAYGFRNPANEVAASAPPAPVEPDKTHATRTGDVTNSNQAAARSVNFEEPVIRRLRVDDRERALRCSGMRWEQLQL